MFLIPLCISQKGADKTHNKQIKPVVIVIFCLGVSTECGSLDHGRSFTHRTVCLVPALTGADC